MNGRNKWLNICDSRRSHSCDEYFSVLGRDAVYVGIQCQRFGGACHVCLRGSTKGLGSQKMEVVSSSETLVPIHQCERRRIPGD